MPVICKASEAEDGGLQAPLRMQLRYTTQCSSLSTPARRRHSRAISLQPHCSRRIGSRQWQGSLASNRPRNVVDLKQSGVEVGRRSRVTLTQSLVAAQHHMRTCVQGAGRESCATQKIRAANAQARVARVMCTYVAPPGNVDKNARGACGCYRALERVGAQASGDAVTWQLQLPVKGLGERQFKLPGTGSSS